MAALHKITTHDLMTNKVRALEPKVLDAQVALAEALLGIEEAITDEAKLSRMQLALVIQVNFQVEQGIDPMVSSIVESSHTKQAVHYRDRTVDPRARVIVDAVLPSVRGLFKDSLTSVRRV